MAWAAVIAAPLFRHAHHELSGLNTWINLHVMDSIATGCLLAVYAPKLIGFVSNRRWLGLAWPLALVLPALIPMGDYLQWLWPLPQLISHSVWTMFNFLAGIGILWAITAKPGILNHWLPVWVGAMSYSLYLWQMPFMNPDAPINLWLRIPLAFACAALSYYAIERPALALRGWTQRRKRTPGEAPADHTAPAEPRRLAWSPAGPATQLPALAPALSASAAPPTTAADLRGGDIT